jgi:hypothetical protein
MSMKRASASLDFCQTTMQAMGAERPETLEVPMKSKKTNAAGRGEYPGAPGRIPRPRTTDSKKEFLATIRSPIQALGRRGWRAARENRRRTFRCKAACGVSRGEEGQHEPRGTDPEVLGPGMRPRRAVFDLFMQLEEAGLLGESVR